MNDLNTIICVAFGVVALLAVCTIISVRSYQKRQPSDPTAERHRQVHDKYVAEAAGLGIELTGKESSAEVSALIGQHHRRIALGNTTASSGN